MTGMRLTTCSLVLAACMLALVGEAKAELYDFADGTLQGWSEGDPFGLGGFYGTLDVILAGGNPGPYMRATDTVPGWGSLAAQAPSTISGDLRRFERIIWDELLPSGAIRSTDILLKGVDGTCYRSDYSIVSPLGEWSERDVLLEAGPGWTLLQGSASLDAVLSNAAALYIELDVVASTVAEAGVDNVHLVSATTGVPVSGFTHTSWGKVKSMYRE